MPSSKGQCAKYVRMAIQAANGATIQPTGIVSAKDYAPFLFQFGYKSTTRTHEQAITGDVAILEGQAAHKHGHIAIKCADGKWRSDFVQNSFWIYRDGSRPGYKVYTLDGSGSDPLPPAAISLGDIVEFNSSINIRNGAGTSFDFVDRSNIGDRAVVLSGPKNNNGYTWWEIQKVDSGLKGWAAVGSNWFQVKYSVKKGDTVKFNTTVNYRSEPSASGSFLGKANLGETAKVISDIATVADGYAWFRLNINGQYGWAAHGNNWFESI